MKEFRILKIAAHRMCTSYAFVYLHCLCVRKYNWTWNEITHFSAIHTDSIFTLQDFPFLKK